jgi:fructose-bisphosphate aldolase class II
MPLVKMKGMLRTAKEKGYAVGAFEFWSLDSAQAVVEAAEEQNMPVILQVGPLEGKYAGSLRNIAEIARIATENASVPVALHADHFETYEDICEAIEAGFTSVMIDASALSYEKNVELTKKVVAAAGPGNVTVEAELGRLAGNEADIAVGGEEAFQTDPGEAAAFVEATGIDALAVAIGTAHGFYKFKPRINILRLEAIAEKVSIPMVLHGGSGTPDDMVAQAIRHGICKVNICTELIAAFGRDYMTTQNKPGFKYNVPNLFGSSKLAGKKLAASKIKLFSCR